MAAPPLDVEKDQVRLLVLQHGVREAARMCNLNENTVLAWSNRGNWLAHLREKQILPASMQPKHALNAINPVDATVNQLQEDSKETRLSLSRSARRLAQAAETAPLEQAGDALQVGKLAQLVHGWASQQPSVRISMFGTPAIDVEAEYTPE